MKNSPMVRRPSLREKECCDSLKPEVECRLEKQSCGLGWELTRIAVILSRTSQFAAASYSALTQKQWPLVQISQWTGAAGTGAATTMTDLGGCTSRERARKFIVVRHPNKLPLNILVYPV